MELRVTWKQARAAAIQCADGSIFETDTPWRIYINGVLSLETKRTQIMLYDLEPATQYTVTALRNQEKAEAHSTTLPEAFTLNVKDFGAKGDGVTNDTPFIQAAILACPPESRVLIPEGVYKVTSIFLKDNVRIELAKGAVLSAFTDRTMFPVLKGCCMGEKTGEEMILGTWEGDRMDMFAGIITGIGNKNVCLYGEGLIDGNSGFDNWWHDVKNIRIAARPRMIFLNRCEDIQICGITVQNSPSWNIHPYFSKNLKFICMNILGPKDSPNTDGLNPEACDGVEIAGCYFSVGDDCIAIKSGKISVGAKYKTPSSNILIRQCCMRDGHGGITLGSEMAGGVKNVRALQCRFDHTDRGLRIKTRRGRGKDAIIDGILFEDIEMDGVLTPFVVNSFYFCDADGHSEYVQSKEPLPVDERTPELRSLCFRNIRAKNCHIAGAFFYGLPEKKIEYIEMKHVKLCYASNACSGMPASMDGFDPNVCKMGIFAKNVKTLVLEDIRLTGHDGDAIRTENVDNPCIKE
ncbi:MAG: glycoside hydrolase family 28 protein [Oscillospiraceae bacterium]|nr:glycoside hydrolase family 28 protein [Oscillospiraceae bacterium]